MGIPVSDGVRLRSPRACAKASTTRTEGDLYGNPLNHRAPHVTPETSFVSFDGNRESLDFGIAKAANQIDRPAPER